MKTNLLNLSSRLFIFLFLAVLSDFCVAQNVKPQINHIAYCTQDLKKSTAFYTDVLELTIIPNPFNDKVHQWFGIGPDIQLHLIEGNCPAETHNIGNHLCFKVASLPDFIKHLEQYHIKYGNFAGEDKKIQVRPDGVNQVYLQDPDGYWIEINDAK